ncbi:PAS domain S-box protein [Pseudoneobacillus rhizosphaerae]|uniref:histidine kinase n=1 Tax=Pseudoneobacillus rhizosphaerae TaxID=2880968 RepID=A0A9C7GA15_9BACI|nr:PAS domain S-box protein [Pseudoneobacillus rhizosphaerae]CAG9608766.1 Sporulation kinase E [Pseudoneobacillus rhizosphaerae]
MKKKRLLVFYFIVSIVWIYGSNFLLNELVSTQYISQLERLKEILYVLVTGFFFYFFISKTVELNVSKEDEKRLSTLINSMVDFVNFKDGEGRWIEANEFGLKLFQIDHVDYRGKKDSELADYSPFYAEALRFCEISDEDAWKNRKITRIEERLALPNGTIKTFDTIKVPLFNPDGSRKGLVIIGRDITERIEIEKLLEESRQQYKSLFEYSPDIVYMLDLEGYITNVNAQFTVITGYSHKEIIRKHFTYVLPNHFHASAIEYLSKVKTSKIPEMFELEIEHKDGQHITLQCNSLPIIVDGKMTGFIGYGKDVTSLRLAEERLRRTEKLSVVGELSASVAHEIRNPLTSLKGFVQILQVEDPKHQFYYQIMHDELNRINHIVSELLLLAKPQQMKFTHANINKLFQDVLSLLRTEANLNDIQIDFSSSFHELWIECEPNQLKQLFINIIKNAMESSYKDGVVSIFLEELENEFVSVKVMDKGCGISKELLEKIGEPFYSSKEKGTGLGLTVSFKIVQSHNGSIQFESEQDVGTTVTINLPKQQPK